MKFIKKKKNDLIEIISMHLNIILCFWTHLDSSSLFWTHFRETRTGVMLLTTITCYPLIINFLSSPSDQYMTSVILCRNIIDGSACVLYREPCISTLIYHMASQK